MTPEDEMKAIVEKAGECWHDLAWDNQKERCTTCTKCGMDIDVVYEDFNCVCCSAYTPSPTDLNEISRLEKALGYRSKVVTYSDGIYVALTKLGKIDQAPLWLFDDSEVAARRKALYQAVKEG